jgi:hypothetical protein
MGERESHRPGTFCWAELVTTNAGAAKTFYAPLMGWTYEDRPAGDGTYTMALEDGREVAGLFADEGQAPHWNSYVTVESADAAADRARELGGAVVAPAFDVLDAGRMAVVRDPGGGVVCVWEPRSHPGARLVNAPGALTWNELATRDVEGARSFYGDLFGWRTEDTTGDGSYFVISNGDRSNGGIMPIRPPMPDDMPAVWTPYYGVEDLDAALEQVSAGGGQVVTDVMTMGEAGRFAVIADPQGAPVSLWKGSYDD